MTIIEVLKTYFDPSSKVEKQLEGYDNKNYLVTSDKGKTILKTYSPNSVSLDLLEAENMILSSLSLKGLPEPIAFSNGNQLLTIEIDGTLQYVRMLSFIEGSFMGDVNPTEDLVASLGSFLAKLNLELFEKKNYIIQARHWEWNLSDFDLLRSSIDLIQDPSKRKLVNYVFQQYDTIVRPTLSSLRKSILHNDANECNILCDRNEVTGLIDFGDLAYGHLINETAIALTYLCYDKPNPIDWVSPFLKAYHNVFPYEKKEIEVLYYLIAARLCTSVCNSAKSRIEDPDNTYAQSSEKDAWSMLENWIRIGSIQAEACFKKALGFDDNPIKTVDNLISERHKAISPILSISYNSPVYMKKAAFQYMYDGYGNSYLDAYNNIPHVGHSHPKIVEAGQRQMARLNTNTRYLFDELNDYATRLLRKFPKPLNKVFFVNSGSAASDLAIRLAKSHTQNSGIAVLEHGYHGNTQIGIDISDYKFNNKRGQGQKDFIIKLPLPAEFNGKFKGPNSGNQYADEAEAILQNSLNEIAAFIAEPIVGCGGQVPLAPGYLEKIYPIIRRMGGVCISDEVQTGFGRLGEVFWGFESHNVIPDMVVLGKPMGNGHPIGAVVTTDAIAESFGKGVEFFSSFGGNPVSCEIGSAVLDVIDEEQLQENASIVGKYYQELFRGLQKDFPVIGDVRGSGLFIGIEIVNEHGEPDTELAQHIKNQLRENHILISTDGPYDNVLKSKPPLCFNKSNVEEVVESVVKILQKLRG